MPSLVDFMETLTQEQDKLVLMGKLKYYKDQYLVAGDSKVNSKYKKKVKNVLDKKGDKSSLKRSPQTPRRRTFRRRKVKVKVGSAHIVVNDFILRALA